MKKIILLLMFCSSLSIADDQVRVSVEQNAYQKLHQTVFFIKKTKIRRWQNSNLFSAESDLRLGDFLVSDSKEKKEIYPKVHRVLEHYQLMDSKLKKDQKSVNDLASARPHQRVLRVNQYVVSENDESFKAVDEIVRDLLLAESKLENGVYIKPKDDRVDYYEKQKLIKTSSLKKVSKCEQIGPEKVCSIEKYGVVLVKDSK